MLLFHHKYKAFSGFSRAEEVPPSKSSIKCYIMSDLNNDGKDEIVKIGKSLGLKYKR